MKKLLAILSSVALLSIGSNANAALITSSDISSLDIFPPSGWTSMNTAALFDGVAPTGGPTSGRFVGFRNSGDALSSAAPFDIAITFNGLKNISSFGLHNDWGTLFQQEVSTIELSGYGVSGLLLASESLSGLATGNFAPSVFSLSSFAGQDIQTLVVSITGITTTNFEIREIDIEAQAAQVSAPSSVGMMLMLGSALFIRRKLQK